MTAIQSPNIRTPDIRTLSPDPDGLKPGGRWARILAACAFAEDGLSRAELLELTARPDRSRDGERFKIWRALGDLMALGLVRRRDRDQVAVFDATPAGLEAVASLSTPP